MVTDFSGLEALSSDWDEAVLEFGGPIYMSFDWVKTWWEFYGKDRDLRIFTFWNEQRLVGLVPIYIEAFGLGPWRTRVARIVGANEPPKAFDPPVDPGCAGDVLTHIVAHLMMTDRCDLVSFGPVSEDWAPAAAVRAMVSSRQAGLSVLVSYRRHDVRTVFSLPRTFEQYLATLPARERQNRKRRLRQLEKIGPVTTQVVHDPEALELEFDRFVDEHARQWQAVGRGGHFAAWPAAKQFHGTLIRRQGRFRRVRFYKLLCGGEVVANRYAYLWGGTLFSELPSRRGGAPWEGVGLGGTAYLKLFEMAITARISRVDSGLGHYENKDLLGGTAVPVGTFRLVGRCWRSRLRSTAFLFVAGAVRLLFQKVWYRRLLPKLPARIRRSQWQFWVRLDA